MSGSASSRRRRWSGAAIAAVLAIGAGVAALALAPAAAAADPPTLDEQFNVDGQPDQNTWLYTLGTAYPGGPGNFGTGEVETNTSDPANVKVSDGNLVITPQRDGAGNWTSARIETKRSDYKPGAGQVMTAEARLQFPNVGGEAAKGYWPAFWMLGSPYRSDRWSWPAVGEFDIAENVNGLNWSYSVLHCGYKAEWGGPCNEPNGINSGEKVCAPVSCQGGFHTYRFQWDRSTSPEELRWYLDGTETLKVKQTDIPADVWSSMTGHEGYHVILNVAISGAFPTAKTGNATPATEPGHPMLVDYVKVSYGAGAGGGGGGGGSTPDPTTPGTPDPTTPGTPVPTTPGTPDPTTPGTPDPTTPTTPDPTTPGTPDPTTPGTPNPTTPGTPDPTTPAPAGEFKVSRVTGSEIELSWPAVPGAVRYGLLRAGIEIGSTEGTSIVDGGLLPGLPYIHSIRAYGADGGVLSTTQEISTTTPA